MAFCGHCGNKLPQDRMRFCPFCGTPLRQPSYGINDFYPEVEGDINALLSELGKVKPTATRSEHESPYKIDRLIKDDRLESDSQAKIGTFEKLYCTNYISDSKVTMYGYDDIDYASLVSLLAAALELELNMSLYQVIRKSAGIPIPEKAFKDTKEKEIKTKGLAVNVGKASQMYGALIELFSLFRDVVSQYVGNTEEFLESLKSVAKIRNEANHRLMIEKDAFLEFYRTYSCLFNKTIGKLLDLKTSLKEQEKGHGHKSYADAGTYASSEDTKDISAGVIFTDSRKLAVKYEGEINYSVSKGVRSYSEKINSWLQNYAKQLQALGINYTVLDLADGHYDYILDERNDWRAHLDILDKQCKKLNIDGEHPAALFIIGGTDVIPMPQFHNPGQNPVNEAQHIDWLDNTVDADFPYSYPAGAVKVTAKGELSLDALSQEIMKPRFHVGRLPLESGYVKTSMENDLKSYLERALSAYADGGIQVDSPLMTTCRRAMKVGTYMTEGLPLSVKTAMPDTMQAGQMITSPQLSLKAEKEFGADHFKSALSQSDMLIFLLHGGGGPTSGSYAGDYIDETNRRIMPVAYDPSLLQFGQAKCIATVCCFGAKYIGYSREVSTLLGSIYKDTLSFMGSSRSAYGVFDDTLGNGIEDTSFYSVRLMRSYLQLLFAGIQGGEALTKAKTQYINGVVSQQVPDRIEQGLTTILEFNYYGDPLLWMKPRIPIPASYEVTEDFIRNEVVKEDKWSVDYEPVGKGIGQQVGLLERIRSIVDRSFEEIHSIVSDKLYKEFGLEPREFYGAHKYATKNGEKGYTLRYRHTEGDIYSDTFVKIDRKGKVLNMYHTY